MLMTIFYDFKSISDNNFFIFNKSTMFILLIDEIINFFPFKIIEKVLEMKI